MGSGKDDWVVLPIDRERFENLFGLAEIRRFFKPKAEPYIPTLDAAALDLEAMEGEEEIPTFDTSELLIEPVEPEGPGTAKGSPTLRATPGARPPVKAR